MSDSTFYLLLLCILISLVVVPIIIFVCISISKHKKEKALLTNKLIDTLIRYKRIKLNMDENEMLSNMNFRYDKTMTNEFTIYRFVYISKGGSGKMLESISSNTSFNNEFSISGGLYGKSEQHDESVVIIKCVNGKVTEVNPYNMSSIQIPTSYNELVDLSNLIGITI